MGDLEEFKMIEMTPGGFRSSSDVIRGFVIVVLTGVDLDKSAL